MPKFLLGLGIPNIGSTSASTLSTRYKSLDAIAQASRQELQTLPGIGAATADAIVTFFADPQTQRVIERLQDVLHIH